MVNKTPDTGKDLMAQITAGDELAFKTLFETYSKRLFSFALTLTKSPADAEEIIQDCFTSLWLQKHQLPEINAPEAYLYRMVRNRTIDHLRKISREQKLISQVWSNLSQQDGSMEASILAKEYQQLINQALGGLSAQKQQVYRLSREKEYSHEEIAAITGLSKSRVNNILSETLKYIKSYLDKHSGELGMIFWIQAWNHFH